MNHTHNLRYLIGRNPGRSVCGLRPDQAKIPGNFSSQPISWTWWYPNPSTMKGRKEGRIQEAKRKGKKKIKLSVNSSLRVISVIL
jgi:hypothetical protein